MYHILTICTGNICRSPMAEIVLSDEIKRRGLAGKISVTSAGISDEEHDNPIDSRAVNVLEQHSYHIPNHFAHRATANELAEADLILPMTAQHYRAVLAMTGKNEQDKVRMYRSFEPKLVRQAGGRLSKLDIADPWYGERSDFETAFEQISHTAPRIIDWVVKQV